MKSKKTSDSKVDYLTVTEVAKLLRVTGQTIRNLALKGEFGEAIVVGKSIRIPAEGYNKFLTNNRRSK